MRGDLWLWVAYFVLWDPDGSGSAFGYSRISGLDLFLMEVHVGNDYFLGQMALAAGAISFLEHHLQQMSNRLHMTAPGSQC